VSILSAFKAAKRNLKSRIFWAITEIIRIAVPKGKSDALLVMKIDALGDLFVWFSSGIQQFSEYCKTYPDGAKILVREELADFISELGLFEEVLPINVAAFRSNLGYRIKLLCRLRRHGFGEIIQARIARDFLTEDLITRTVDAAVARSAKGDHHNLSPWEARVGDRWYRTILHVDAHSGHELERNRALSAAALGTAPRRFHLSTAPARPPAGLRSNYFVIAPGAGWAPRRWPLDKFVELARRSTAAGLQCVVVGGRGDASDGERIRTALGGDALNLCGTLSHLDLAALVKSATIVIGNESGPAHIAAYFNVPSLAILGGGHYGWFMPYPDAPLGVRPPRVAIASMPCFGCNWICQYQVDKHAPVPCIRDVSVEAAWLEISAALNERTPSPVAG